MTRQWVLKAEEDYGAVQVLRVQKPRFHDSVCFHCQQCAEKYLKALLQEIGRSIPKIHDCAKLLDLLPEYATEFRGFRRGLKTLSHYAVASRYPEEDATGRQATSAIQWCDKVRTSGRAILGLK